MSVVLDVLNHLRTEFFLNFLVKIGLIRFDLLEIFQHQTQNYLLATVLLLFLLLLLELGLFLLNRLLIELWHVDLLRILFLNFLFFF